MDILTPEARSRLMSRIRGRNTGPEIVVRQVLHSMGYRFRLHNQALPGTPDIVLQRYRLIFFVHGCFWHRHPGCRFAYMPKSRIGFWQEKFEKNAARDQKARETLEGHGWKVRVIWECQTHDPQALARLL